MTKNALYKLEPITDNPKYEGFVFVRKESLRAKGTSLISDFGPQGPAKRRHLAVPPLAPFWTPQRVVGRVRPYNDYPAVAMLVPAFRRRAVDALRDFLEPNGELLPLISSVGEYYAYNITTVADILDVERSEFVWTSNEPRVPITIQRYECFPEKMAGLSIFRITDKPSSAFVSQTFVDRVRLHRLQGFHFIKLWPLPPGVSSQEEDQKETEKNLLVETARGPLPVKGNTVVIRLETAKAKASRAEKQRLAKMMDELDSLLYDPRPDAPYFGSVEGDDRVDGELRIFLTCPDADALYEKLRPWLARLWWKGRAAIMKRYGEFTDPNCREESIDL